MKEPKRGVSGPTLSRPVDILQTRLALFMCGLVALELVFIAFVYSSNFNFNCRSSAPAVLCQVFSLAVERAVFFFGVFMIVVFSKPALFGFLYSSLTDAIHSKNNLVKMAVAQFVGFLLILLPYKFAAGDVGNTAHVLAFIFWIAGGFFATLGAALFIAPFRGWVRLALDLGSVRLALLGLAIVAPEIVQAAHGVWFFEPLTNATFQTVLSILHFFGEAATAQPELHILRSKTFAVAIGWQCSGVEGFALAILFMLCYFYAFADSLRFPQVWVLLPFSLVLSWMLNVVRITSLFAIGSHISPKLAISSFHSNAGWLMFSVLTLTIISVSRFVRWFQRASDTTHGRLPLRKDWVAARTLPFAAFMGAALVLSTFTEVPELWYFVKLILIVGTLALFFRLYEKLELRLDGSALALGMVVGVAWILTGARQTSPSALDTALQSLSGGLLVGWIVARLFGTIIIVPLVEELFFRGYVLDRLAVGPRAKTILAVTVSTGFFALFHDRWIVAGVAGLVYGLLYLRHRLLSDAIVAHTASNLIIASYALVTHNWSLI
jgi:uncharacterized protein